MEVLFIGVACTDEAIKQSNQKYYNGKATVRPQQYFDLNLICGLSEYCNVKAISEPPVASYPRSKCVWYNRREDTLSESLTIKYIALLNILGIKTFIILITILLESLNFCMKNKRKEKAIILGYLSFYSSLPAIIISKIFGVKIFVIVPDIPKYTREYNKKNNNVRDLLNKILITLNKLTESEFDGYILLTKYMNKLLNKNNKPYIVMEGFFNQKDISEIENTSKVIKKIVMYAGTLHEKFGIKKLIEAFELIERNDCELWIYGEGDYLDDIQEICHMNINIKYRGIKNRDEILKLEKEVTLLVNARPSDEEFTKYSFPSKTIEYMASGTPLLTTKLPGIPEEYFKYLYTFEEENKNVMAKNIQEVLSYSSEVLNEFGGKARIFILRDKNNKVQAKRIYQFIRKYNFE